MEESDSDVGNWMRIYKYTKVSLHSALSVECAQRLSNYLITPVKHFQFPELARILKGKCERGGVIPAT